MSEHEIDFPSISTIETNVKIFEGDAPDNVDVESAFREGSFVGLFVNSSNPSSGPEWGLTSGGTLTAQAFVDVFEKTSDTNNGIMRLRSLDSLGGNAWNSLIADGSLTGWSIRTSGENTDYYGPVLDSLDSRTIAFCSGGIIGDTRKRILLGPTSQGSYENIYLLHDCGDNDLGNTPKEITADIGETQIRTLNSGSGVLEIYTCIDPGADGNPVTPAVFTGPSVTPETYFTSYTPLTGGAQCDYPYQFNSVGKVQQWSFDCSVSGWIGEGSTITQGIPPAQGNQGFQGSRGFQGFQGFQGLKGYEGPTGVDGVVGNDYEIQYKDGNDLSANSLSTITTNSSLDPDSGYSGNFQNYSESFKIDNNAHSNGDTINLNFDAYNVYRASQIELNSDKTLTFSGFDTAKTGQTMTLVLGYSGGSNSQIVFPGEENIYWRSGPLNGGGGETSYINPTSPKENTVFFFINDGERTYGNYRTDYRKA